MQKILEVHLNLGKALLAIAVFACLAVLFAYSFEALPIDNTTLAIDWKHFYKGIRGGNLKYHTCLHNPPWSLLFILSPHFNYHLITPLLLTSGVMLSLIWLIWRPQKEGAFVGWAWTIAGILYIGWLLSYLVALRGLENGRDWTFLALFTTFGSDTTAFFIGRALGKHRLAPSISPSKTWEGAIAGLFGAIIISLLFILPTPLCLHLNWGQAILLGLLVSIFGQLGDLVESLFKRNMGVKDSSKLIPGHGGFLDRIDSVVFAGIVVYYYVIWVVL